MPDDRHPSPAPLPPADRIRTLDALRGFALFGILLVNMQGFKTPLVTVYPGYHYHPGLANSLTLEAIQIFASGKFVSTFAFLFGLGLVMQQERMLAAGHAFPPFLRRRMGVLLIMGMIHGIVLWAGDVLFLYAIFGLAGTRLIRLSARTLFTIAGVVSGLLLACLLLLALVPYHEDPGELTKVADAWVDAYRSADFRGMVSIRFSEWFHLLFEGLFYYVPYSFIFFVLGMACGKSGILGRLDSVRGWVGRFAAPSLLIGTALSLVFPLTVHGFLTSSGEVSLLGIAGFLIGSMLIALVYLAAAASVFHSGRFPRATYCLAAVGRLSLSNYLLQSLITNGLFMGWGMGLYGRVPSHAGVLITALVFTLQIVLSHLWLRRHQTGPMERLWRNLSYPGRGSRPAG